MKLKHFLILIIGISLCTYAYFYFTEDQAQNTAVISETVQAQEVRKIDRDLENIMNREDFKKMMELEARQIFLDEKREKLVGEINAIEIELESIRTEKASFQESL